LATPQQIFDVSRNIMLNTGLRKHWRTSGNNLFGGVEFYAFRITNGINVKRVVTTLNMDIMQH